MSDAGRGDLETVKGDDIQKLDEAELAALADEIEAQNADDVDDQQNVEDHPTLAAAEDEPQPQPHLQYDPQTSGSSWNTAYDHNSQRWYYFNLITGETSWTPPTDWLPNTEQQQQQGQEQAPAAQPSQDHQPQTAGYYYLDAHGNVQGPYSKEQLTAWRSALPMDLPLWYQETNSPSAAGSAGGHKDVEKIEGDTVAEARIDKEAVTKEEAAAQQPSVALERETIELAKIIGDGALLSQWREENPDLAMKSCAAPPASTYEQDLKKDTFTSLAEAALAGLPPTDEAVHLARMATSTGQPLQDVVQWSREAGGEYEVTAMHIGKMGRIQVTDPAGGAGSLYAEMGGWVDPKSIEDQLRKAAERKKRALSGEELKAVKEKKKQMKEKKMRAWLQD